MSDWIETSWSALGMVLISALAVYAWIIVLTRISGLRSFSKMSGFDFALTVATGSVAGAIFIAKDPPLMQGLFALLVLFSMQMAVAAIRRRSAMVEKLVDNRPRLIMWQGEMIDTQMRRAKITRADLIAKLREANVTSPGQIHAVVAETTGDVSVLHGHGDAALSSAILGDVIGIEPYRHLLKD
ncbi:MULTISPECIES: DUF421 domain-containing protein [Henriciella]|uniref:DUF421 domain-containing protein n=1 Tax=Henriciella TaxID=453849 RepID=UPI0035145757